MEKALIDYTPPQFEGKVSKLKSLSFEDQLKVFYTLEYPASTWFYHNIIGIGTEKSLSTKEHLVFIKHLCHNDLFYFAKYILKKDKLHERPNRYMSEKIMIRNQPGLQERKLICEPRGTYKCLKKGTKLLNYGINERGLVERADLVNQKDFRDDGLKVTFSSGREHICTKDHRFRTIDGWKEPYIGMRVAVARSLPNPDPDVDSVESYLMGLLVGDGCLRKTTPRLSCADREILDYLIVNEIETHHIAKYDYSIIGFFDKVRDCGLEGTNSWNKFIPEKYEGSADFLRGLFDADASVSKRQASIVYVTVSERLADDVMRNLLYFGIVARKHHYRYEKSDKSPAVDCYHVTLNGEFLRKYQLFIGFVSNKKSRRLARWCKKAYLGKNNNCDTIPNEWKNLLKQNEKHALRFTHKIRIDNKYANSRNKVLHCGELLENHDVISLAKSDIFWDEIKNIEPANDIEFSAIGSSIENYISDDGVIHHNTTLGSIAYPIWSLCRNPNLSIQLDSETDKQAHAIYGVVRDELEYNVLLRTLYGEFKTDRWNETSFNIAQRTVFSRNPSMFHSGVDSSTNGLHPDIIIVDDPCSEINTQNLEQIEKVYYHVKTLTPLLEKDGEMIFIVTRWRIDDLVSRLIENERETFSIVSIKSCYGENGDGKDAEDGLYAPEILSEDYLEKAKKSMGMYLFSANYLNDPKPDADKSFKLEWLRYYEGDTPMEMGPNGEIKPMPLSVYMAMDASWADKTSNTGRDPTAIVVIGFSEEGDSYLLDVFNRRITPTEVIEKVFQMYDIWNPISFATEDIGTQKGLNLQIEEEMHKRQKFFPMVRVKHQARGKQARIMSLTPLFEQGTFYINDRMKEFKEQYLYFNPVVSLTHDDILDAIEMLEAEYREVHVKPEESEEDFFEETFRIFDRRTGRM